MSRIIVLLFALVMSLTTTVQGQSRINMSVDEPVCFKKLMITGASAKPLEAYSDYAAERSATFTFSKATIGNMKNCRYSVTCDKGKITGIYLTVQDPTGCQELLSFVNKHFGQPSRELTEKRDGRPENLQYTFNLNGTRAELSVIVDKQAVLTMR